MTTKIKRGDKARVVIEGVIGAVVPGGFDIGNNYFAWDRVTSVEVLPEPERDWQRGDIVRDSHGLSYLRLELPISSQSAWRGFDGRVRSNEYLLRPLILLVPESK